tara:strand:- start:483 stop:836 length:354 start_codon:yes stop_codon:yes gene_type:complete
MTKLLSLRLDLISKMKARLDHKQEKYNSWLDDAENYDDWLSDTWQSEIHGYKNAVNDLEKILDEKLDHEVIQKELKSGKLKGWANNGIRPDTYKELMKLKSDLITEKEQKIRDWFKK